MSATRTASRALRAIRYRLESSIPAPPSPSPRAASRSSSPSPNRPTARRLRPRPARSTSLLARRERGSSNIDCKRATMPARPTTSSALCEITRRINGLSPLRTKSSQAAGIMAPGRSSSLAMPSTSLSRRPSEAPPCTRFHNLLEAKMASMCAAAPRHGFRSGSSPRSGRGSAR